MVGVVLFCVVVAQAVVLVPAASRFSAALCGVLRFLRAGAAPPVPALLVAVARAVVPGAAGAASDRLQEVQHLVADAVQHLREVRPEIPEELPPVVPVLAIHHADN